MSTSVSLSRVSAAVVIGGGIAGATVAHELARQGARVTLLESGSIAHSASGRNMGLLLRQTNSLSVLTVQRSLEIYRELASGFDFGLRPIRQLLLALGGAQVPGAGARATALQAAGAGVRELTRAELVRALPGLAPDITGGWLVEGGWALNPAAATHAFLEAARARGAEVRTGVRVHRVLLESGRVTGVATDGGTVAADAVIVATGTSIPDLVPALPVAPARGWVLRTAPLPFELPWVVQEASWPGPEDAARAGRPPTFAEVARGGHDRPAAHALLMAPIPGGAALVGTSLAPSLGGAPEGADMPRRLAERALLVLPALADTGVAAAWSGLRPVTPDGRPAVGAVSGCDGLFVHAGHGSVGMATAPATARWLVAGEAGELEAYRPDRFDRGPGSA